jgi:hypothetical protein
MKRTKIGVDENTHTQLLYLSKVTGLSMAQIIRELMQNLTPLSVMYKNGATLRIEHRITESQVYITLHGYSPTFTSGRAFSEAEMQADIKKHFEGAKQ